MSDDESNDKYFLFIFVFSFGLCIHRSCPGGKQSRKNIDESNASTEGEKERELRQREAVLEPARNKLLLFFVLSYGRNMCHTHTISKQLKFIKKLGNPWV